MRDPFTFTHEAAKRYGDVFHLPVPMHNLVLTNHPDLTREIFYDRDATTWGFPGFPKPFKAVFGETLGFLDGERYTERRRLISPMFGKRTLSRLADDFVDEMLKRLDPWEEFAENGSEIDLQHEFAMILLPAFLRNMFSISPTDKQIHRYDQDLREVLSAGAAATWLRLPPSPVPLPGVPSLLVSVPRMWRDIGRILDSRAKDPVEHHDLLQVLVDARLPDGTSLDPRDVKFDTWGLMVAGYDTVVAALSWMFSLLPTNPAAQQRLFDEVDDLGDVVPSAEHLDRLGWVKQCFDEAQRLQGNVMNGRFAKVDTELAGFQIPSGTLVGSAMFALHRDPRWWAHPESYDPTHFDKDQVADRPATAFIPFGTGSHQCVGMAMAYQNAQLLTALVCQRYRVHLRPGWAPEHKMVTAVPVKGGVPCTITRR